jgi:hypothetical protein
MRWHRWLRINRVAARDSSDALERGGVAAGQGRVHEGVSLRSEIRRAGWFN